MLDALKNQWVIKQEELQKIVDESIIPKQEELSNTVKKYFIDNNLIEEDNFDKFNYNGNSLTINDIRISLSNYSYENNKYNTVELNWYGSTCDENDSKRIKYLINLGKIAESLSQIKNQFFVWYNDYKNNEQIGSVIKNEFDNLEKAIYTLENEIRRDEYERYKQIGFELSQFKMIYDYNRWAEKDEDRIRISSKNVWLQTGRSQYEGVYAFGYKVLGKKGNKYEIAVYNEDKNIKVYNVLEKKFEDFAHNVVRWEGGQADEKKNQAQTRYNQYISDLKNSR
jgi:hypothetical protein